MTEYDAKMVAADIVTLLFQSLLTLHNGSITGPGIQASIDLIAFSYDLDASDRNAVKVRNSQ